MSAQLPNEVVAGYLLFGSLLLGPPAGLAFALALRRWATREVRLATAISALAAIVGVVAIFATRWSLAGKVADFAAVALAYLGFCVLVFLATSLIRRRWLAVTALTVGLVSIAIAYSPFTLLVAAISLNEATSLEVPLLHGACRATWDWPLGEHQFYEVLWRPALVPFVERRVASWRMFELDMTQDSMRPICDQHQPPTW
jgi:hypothetical protein